MLNVREPIGSDMGMKKEVGPGGVRSGSQGDVGETWSG